MFLAKRTTHQFFNLKRRGFSNTQVMLISKQILQQELKNAMKLKEKSKVTAIKSVLADILNSEKSGLAKQPSVAELLQRAIKKRTESLSTYQEAGRDDLAAVENEEVQILSQFLPKQLSKEEINSIIEEIVVKESIERGNPKELGKLMKHLSEQVDPSLAPRKLVSDLAKQFLSK